MRTKLLKFFDLTLGYILLLLPRRKGDGKNPSKHLMLIKLSAMGDVICLAQVLRWYEPKLKSFEIEILTTHRSNPKLFTGLDFVKVTVLPTSPLKLVFFLLFNFRCLRKKTIINFDQYYNLSQLICYLGEKSFGFKTALAGSKLAASVSFAPDDNIRNNFERLLLHALGLERKKTDADARSNFTFLPKKITNDQVVFENYSLIICPGTSINAEYRRYDFESFMWIAESFQNKNKNVYFLGGPDEECFVDRINSRGFEAHNLIGKIDITDLAGIMLYAKKAKCILLCNDSGLLHLADAQGVTTCSVFGPNLESRWGPLIPSSKAVSKNTPCRPCIQTHLGVIPSSCKFGNVECMNVSKELLLENLMEQFDEIKRLC